MKILSYAPHIEAYVAVTGKGGSVSYYDLSPDITSARVTRNVDTNSSFDITLQNKGGKYNGVFTPMDKIVIYMTKTDRHRILTGYIRQVDVFTLFPDNFHLSGSCTLYQLQQLYWDPAVQESYMMMVDETSMNTEGWRGFSNVIWKLMNNVGAWSPDRVKIGNIPQEVLTWAHSLYQAKLEDIGQIKSMVNEFYEILQTSGPMLGGGGSDGYGGYGGTASSEAVEHAVQWMIKVADDNTHGYSQASRTFNPDIDCSSFVYYALLNNGWTADQLGGTYPFTTHYMESILGKCGWKGYAFNGDPATLKRGDIMLNPQTHTEMYIGDGKTVGAHSNYDGRTGDSSGREVSVVTMSKNWQRFLRYEG